MAQTPALGDPPAQRALAAASAARGRLDESLLSGVDPNVPLGELLHWWYSLEEYLRGDATYYDRRQAEDAGRAFGATIYARGRGTHSLIEQVRRSSGALGSSAFGTTPFGGPGTWRWVSLPNLGEPVRPERFRRDDWYRDLVAGKPVLQVIDLADLWLQTQP